MAINYANAFDIIKQLKEAVDVMIGFHASLDSKVGDTITAIQTGNQQELFRVPGAFTEDMSLGIAAEIAKMSSLGDAWLMHEQIVDELPIRPRSIKDALKSLYKDMNENSQSVGQNSVTVGAVTTTANYSNVGTLNVDKRLSGRLAPHPNRYQNPPNLLINGVDSEIAYGDDLAVYCIEDSRNGGVSEGYEKFMVVGKKTTDPYMLDGGKFGGPFAIDTVLTKNLESNMLLQSFNGDLPSGWEEVTAGSYGEDTTVTRYGYNTLKFEGNCKLRLPVTNVKSRGMYVVGFLVNGTGTMDFQVTLEGTNPTYTTDGSSDDLHELQPLPIGGSGTQWTPFYLTTPTPIDISADLYVVIEITNYVSGKINFTHGFVCEPNYFNGLNWSIYPGDDKFLEDDRFELTTSNNEANVFQTYFRDQFGFQIPSSGTPTIT